MINIYEQGHEDFASLGLGRLFPTKCEVTEELNGAFELELEHPMDANGVYDLIKTGRVLRVPVPSAVTPLINVYGLVGTEVYEATERARVYSRPSTTTGSYIEVSEPAPYDPAKISAVTVDTQDKGQAVQKKWKSNGNRVLANLKVGDTVTVMEKTDTTWWQVTTAKGDTGYIQAAKLNQVYVHASTPTETIQERKIRSQLFRIYRVEKDTEELKIRAFARHVFYDLLANVVLNGNLENAIVPDALNAIKVNCTQSDHGFSFYTNDTTTTITGDYSRKGVVEALLEPDEGVAAAANLRMTRDNFDVFLLKRKEVVRMPITYRHGLKGVTLDMNEDGIVNRIVPVGQDKDGNPLMLDPPYIDSPRNDEATMLRAKTIEYNEAKESKDMTIAQAKAKLEEMALADFEAGIDLPEITVEVDVLQLGDTEEYAQFRELDRLYLGDLVRVVSSQHGIDLNAEMTEYTYDAIAKRYTKVGLGVTSAKRTIGSVGAYMIPGGSLSGRKIAVGGVDASRLENMSVTSAKIGLAAIDAAHMKTATVEYLSAESLTAVKAEIDRLVSEEITTDELYANLAAIAVAEITTANINNANISWADINTLVTVIGNIAVAKIGAANIDYAKIVDMVTETAIITEGVGGKLYINRLAVTDANMVSLTVGKLMLKTTSGGFVELIADGQGGVTTQPVLVAGANISNNTIAGGKLIESTITARELNVASIFADTALIKAIKAANIDVADLFAAQATINELDSYIVRANTITALKGQLSLWADEKISLAVGGVRPGGKNICKGTDVPINATGQGQVLYRYGDIAKYYGKQVIISFDYETYGVPVGTSFALIAYDTWQAFTPHIQIGQNNQSGHVVGVPVTLASALSTSVYIGWGGTIAGTIVIKNLMLNEGNVPMPWDLSDYDSAGPKNYCPGFFAENYAPISGAYLSGDGKLVCPPVGDGVQSALPIKYTPCDPGRYRLAWSATPAGGRVCVHLKDYNGNTIEMGAIGGTYNAYYRGWFFDNNGGLITLPLNTASVGFSFIGLNQQRTFNWCSFTRGDQVWEWQPYGVDPASGVKTTYMEMLNDLFRVYTGGKIEMLAGTLLRLTAAVVQIDASDANNSYINFGSAFNVSKGSDGNFALTINSPSDDAIKVNNKPILHRGNVLIQQAQPASGNGVLWIKPVSVADVVYKHHVAGKAGYSYVTSYSRNHLLSAETQDILNASGTYSFTVKFTLQYFGNAGVTVSSINVTLAKGGATVSMTHGAVTIPAWGTKEIIVTGSSTSPLFSSTTSDITCTIQPVGTNPYAADNYLAHQVGSTIDCKIVGPGSGGVAQMCELRYVP
jgi:phage minor structural protein